MKNAVAVAAPAGKCLQDIHSIASEKKYYTVFLLIHAARNNLNQIF